MTVGHSEAEPFWVEFLRTLARRGLRGVKLVTSDAHEGLKAAITKVLGASWQRCRVGPLKNPLSLSLAVWRRQAGGSGTPTQAWSMPPVGRTGAVRTQPSSCRLRGGRPPARQRAA